MIILHYTYTRIVSLGGILLDYDRVSFLPMPSPSVPDMTSLAFEGMVRKFVIVLSFDHNDNSTILKVVLYRPISYNHP